MDQKRRDTVVRGLPGSRNEGSAVDGATRPSAPAPTPSPPRPSGGRRGVASSRDRGRLLVTGEHVGKRPVFSRGERQEGVLEESADTEIQDCDNWVGAAFVEVVKVECDGHHLTRRID